MTRRTLTRRTLTRRKLAGVIRPVDPQLTPGSVEPADVLMCIDAAALARLRATLRHLVVGLVDHPVRLRLLSASRDVEALCLGPVQAIQHPPIRWPFRSGRASQIAESLEEDPPKVVHAASAESYALTTRLAKALDARLAVDVSSMEDCRLVRRLASGRPMQVITFSEPLSQLLRRRSGIPEDSIDLIRPGVIAGNEPACFSDAQRTPTLMCAMPFTRESQVHDLVSALAILRDRGAPFIAFILGEGSREFALRRMVRRKKLNAQVTLANLREGIGDTMSSADLFVVPASMEYVSIRLLQALAVGVLIVARPSPINDALRDGETAMLCPEGSPEALADCLERAINDRDASMRIARGGMEYVRAHHTVSDMAQRTADVYRRLAPPKVSPN